MELIIRYVLVTLALFLAGCTLEANLSELVKMDATFMNGAVTANQKSLTVQNQYLVQSSAGALTDGESAITQDGYKVYLSTQTVILSQQ